MITEPYNNRINYLCILLGFLTDYAILSVGYGVCFKAVVMIAIYRHI